MARKRQSGRGPASGCIYLRLTTAQGRVVCPRSARHSESSGQGLQDNLPETAGTLAQLWCATIFSQSRCDVMEAGSQFEKERARVSPKLCVFLFLPAGAVPLHMVEVPLLEGQARELLSLPPFLPAKPALCKTCTGGSWPARRALNRHLR